MLKNIKSHVLCSVTYCFDNCATYELTNKKFCMAGQATDENRAHAHRKLQT